MGEEATRSGRMITFTSGGWVLLLTAVLSVVIIVVTVRPALERARNRPPGDGSDPATYGFTLVPCLIPRDEIVAGQLHRDIQGIISDPVTMPAASVLDFNAERRGKYVVPTDRVVGVTIGDESRAYPLSILNLHEVVNDRLGGIPIAVTYNPLCDSVVVIDRRSETPGVVPEFGISGLLYNSNLILYDRQVESGTESLWSQLLGRAVTGPAAAAGRELRMLPSELVQWGDWLERHPDGTVIVPDEARFKHYQETSYRPYFVTPELLFPVRPEVPADGLGAKARCVVVLPDDGEPLVYPVPFIAARADDGGVWKDGALTFHYTQQPDVVRVTTGPDEAPVLVVPCLWFAWYAMHPGSRPIGGTGAGEDKP